MHISGQKGKYFLDGVKAGTPTCEGMSAVDLNNWMINSSISDALTAKPKLEFDLMRWLPYIVGGIIAVMAIWAWMGAM